MKNPRPASIRCIDPFPKRYEKGPARPLPLQVVQNLRRLALPFDGVASLAMERALVDTFIAANRDRGSPWAYPKPQSFSTEAIRFAATHQSTIGTQFGRALAHHNITLATGFVSVVAEADFAAVRASDLSKTSAFAGWSGTACRLKLIGGNAPDTQVLLPDFRWRIARRKFSTIGGAWVGGPYFAVFAYEQSTGLIVRIRMWPAWLDLCAGRFAIVRSNLERMFIDAVSECGGIGVCPPSAAVLRALLESFADRLDGEPTKYPFLPDAILFPRSRGKLTFVEVFGLTSLRHYRNRADEKLDRAMRGMSAGWYDFVSYESQRATEQAIERGIRERVARFYRGE